MELDTAMLNKAWQMLNGLYQDHEEEIKEGYLQAEDELSIGLAIKFRPDQKGIKISAAINFVERRCKNSTSIIVDPKQRELFEVMK